MLPLHKLRHALFLAGAAAMAIGFPGTAMAAENGPEKTQIYQNSSGDLVFVMTEPEEYEDQVYQVLGCDLTTFDDDGDKDTTFRFMFDESQTERSYNSSHTEIVVTKYIPAEDIKAGLTEESRTLWNHYLEKYGEFILDSVIAVSNDGGQTYSGSLTKSESEGVATAVPNYTYSDAPLVLSLDNDGDMVFGEGEESRLMKVYSWNDTGAILDFYNQPLTTRNVDEENFAPSSYQHSSDSYPSESERYETYTTWQSGGDDPYFTTYNDSRLYYEDGEEQLPYTDEGPLGMLVPAGGKYINGITVDSMYGSIDIGIRGAVNTWDFDYDYEYYVIRYKDNWEPYLEKRSDTVETSVTRRAYYLYIWNLDLYDFAEATVTNGSMTDGGVTYQSSDEHLMDQEIEIGNTGPVTTEELDQYLITNYGSVAKGTDRPAYEANLGLYSGGNVSISDGASQVISSYLPDDDEHVEWARIETDQDLGNIGYAGAIASASNASAKAAETAADRAEMKAWFDANEIVGNGADIETETKSGTEKSFATVKNDYLRIGYSGQVILDGSECDVIFDEDDDDNTYQTEYGPDDLPPYLEDVVLIFPEQSQETYETTPAFGKDLITVPEDVTVGDYYTGIEAIYQPVLTHIDRVDNLLYKTEAASGRAASGTYDAIKYGFYINEPVTIQKKVDIDSSFSIHEDEDGSDEMGFRDTVTDTQLTDTPYNDARLLNITQLKLDESYWLTFDDEVADSDEYDDEDFAESIDGKYLHFPFDVVLYRNRGGTSYPEYFRCAEQEVDTLGGNITGKNEDGGQYWIELYEDEWSEIEFYIPPWATEKIYDSSAYGQQIQYRIDTVNDEDEISKDIHQIGCQISGWLYDFEILAVNDPMTFDPNEENPEINSWYSFYMNGEEKKTGTQNRLGYNSEHGDINQYVRAGITGEVTDNWDSTDSVVLANGKSSKYADLGMLSKGSSFTFSVKTISNLWHNQDYLKVTPSFTFIDSDGTQYSEDQFTIYYNDYSGKAAGILKKADDAENVVSLSDEGFGGAFTRDDLKFKAQTLNVDSTAVGGESGSYRVSLSNMTDSELETAASKLLETKASISSFSEFYLTDALKIYNGDVKYLSANLYLDEDNVDSIDDLVPVPTEDGDLITEDDAASETERRDNMLKICMQQWFGKYTIPDELYVTTSSEEEIREYANTHGGITKDDPVFEQGGYLVLHLDFVSVKDGSEDLCFAGNGLNLDMWESQNQDKTAKLGGQEIHVGSGDVAVIDLSSRVSDHYETNFFAIH